MTKYIHEIEEMKNKNVILACGATGTGKSTLMNAIISGVEKMGYNEDENYITKV